MSCSNNCTSCGNCSRCGACCAAMLPLTRKEEKRIRDYIKNHDIKPEFFQNLTSINLQCCFYDRTEKKCKIYEVRPSICRSFKCDKNNDTIEKEKFDAHIKAYWNHMNGTGLPEHITDMRLLFYDDPRSFIANLVYGVTDGTMECSKEQFEFLTWYMKHCGQEELIEHLEVEYAK